MAMDLDSGGKGKRKRRPEMNVTPLVDVVLVLLIIFMVMTPMMLKHFSVVVPPESDAPPPADAQQPIVLSVGSDGTIRINRDEVSAEELPNRLRRVLAGRGTRTIVFDAHDDATYAEAAHALDLARGAGATRIAVATEALPGID
jgi:biopolymer transport protein ExbD/biopolymer transport protein TolR